MPRLKFCNGCKQLFEPKDWQLRHGHSSYCSECEREDPRWGPAFRRARAIRLRMAGGRCEECGVAGIRLQCHHVNGNNSDHRIENLKMLCDGCHQYQTNELRQGQRVEQAARPERSQPSIAGTLPAAPVGPLRLT